MNLSGYFNILYIQLPISHVHSESIQDSIIGLPETINKFFFVSKQ